MLRELKVSNFAIIDHINVQFKPGFNVLSGETGSGKSVLLKSLALLMGEKSISGTIKSGCDQATVEGLFDISNRPDIKARLTNSGLDILDDSLVVKRIISEDGKNRVYINGGLSALHSLREIVAPLIEISGQSAPLIEMTGQHENRNLQDRNFHLESLDLFARTMPLRAEVEKLFGQKHELQQKIQALEESSRNKIQRLDFLYYQRDEIKSLDLKEGEELNLENEIYMMRTSAKLAQFVESAECALYSDEESALVRIHKVIQKSLEFTENNKRLSEVMELLQQSKATIEEFVYQLRDLNQSVVTDAAHQELLEQRLSNFRKVQKKYGESVAEILTEFQKIEAEIAALENSEIHIEELKSQLEEACKKYSKEALKLHKLRQEASVAMSKGVNEELADLNMKGLIFSVQVERTPEESPLGISSVEFATQSTKKDQTRSLAKFASGGELSRILLSLKRVVGVSEFPRTYLFDEVDAGVSGVTAEKVGKKLKSIAKNQQVICVTHLPQVAAFADAHFVIEKNTSSREVHMTVSPLTKQDQIKEIARMLSGEKITKSSLANAREMLDL